MDGQTRDPAGTPLVLETAGDVETLVRAHGTHFLVTNRAGDIAPRGARELGLFVDDTRYLSHYELTLGRYRLVRLSAEASGVACNRIDLMATGFAHEEFLDDPQNFLHLRRIQHLDDGLIERLELANYLAVPVTIDLTLRFAGDFADVFEVRGAKRLRRGTSRSPAIARDAVELRYDGLDGRTYRTCLSFVPAPTAIAPDHAMFRLTIEPGATTAIETVVAPSVEPRHAAPSPPRPRRPLEEVTARARADAEEFLRASTRFRCDNALLEHVLQQSSRDLHALSVVVGDHRVLAAGIPWFCCPFGRDTLIAAYEALTLNPELAASSLRALAAFQGRRFEEFTEEEPGKIFHELRFGEMAECREIPHTPYYGTIDATPLFVVVAHAAWRVMGEASLVRDLLPNIKAALAWIDARSDDATALVTYARSSPRGLDNQGWKDSRAGVSFPNGERAAAPIALCEVQGYCVDAYRRGADLLATVGDGDAERYRARAEAFQRLVDERLWIEAEQRYAFAIDGEGRPLPTIVSNLGHLLWSRVAGSGTRARATADLLTQPASLSAFGVRTLAAGQGVFNPMSYHNGTVWPHDNAIIAKGFANYDLMDHACAIFESMIAAIAHFPDWRLPELYCGMAKSERALVRYPVACSPQAWAAAAPLLLLQSVLGIHVHAPEGRLLIRNPRMPPSVGWIELDGLRVGGSRVSIRFRRSSAGRCHVERLDVSGPPLRTLVAIE